MRASLVLAVVAFILVLVGLDMKLRFFPAAPAEATSPIAAVAGVDVFRLQQNAKNLSAQKATDMSVVFTGD